MISTPANSRAAMRFINESTLPLTQTRRPGEVRAGSNGLSKTLQLAYTPLGWIRSMQRREVEIVNKLGLNAPASTKLTQLAAKYQCDVSLARSGRKVNAKSLMG